MAKMKKLPGVLSFQRCLVVTDGLFFNEYADGTTDELMVIRHGIRGTQNVNEKSKKDQATAETSERAVSNPQITDSAKLAVNAKCLQVRFNVRSLAIRDALFSCSAKTKADNEEFRKSYNTFIDKAIASDALMRLALRYARNIVNGRFLWRNRMAAHAVGIDITLPDGSIKKFDALSHSLNRNCFADFSDDEKAVATVLADGWKQANGASQSLKVVAHVDLGVGGGVEVFPSQNYIDGKPRGFARPLYCVGDVPENQDDCSVRLMGQAALRDQKIGNALRTIDTWYPDNGETPETQPIAVEPCGASLSTYTFFREKKGKEDKSAFTFMLALDEIDPMGADGQFLLACLIRGGVYSEGEKDKKEQKE